MESRIRIDGITLSKRLIVVQLWNLPDINGYLDQFCRTLSKHHINLSFLSATRMEGERQITCCVAEEDQNSIKTVLQSEIGLACSVRYISSACILSLFPHRFDLKVLGLVIKAFDDSNIPLYGLASSISTLSFLTRYDTLDDAVVALKKCLDVQSDQIFSKTETD